MQPSESREEAVAESESRFPLPLALRFRHFRNYWLGLLSSVTGYQFFIFGELWLMHELTSSPFYLGLVGLSLSLPAIALNLIGGVSADRFERRKLVILTQLAAAGVILALAASTAAAIVVPWHLLVAGAIVGGINAFNQPARLALFPQYVPREALMSAVALNSSVWQVTRIAGPALAGLIIAVFGTAPVFFVSGAAMVGISVGLRRAPDSRNEGSRQRPVQDVMEGLRFIKANPTLAFLIGMIFFNSFFGIAYIYMMPIFAVDVLDAGATGQGYLLSAAGVGSLTVTVWMATRQQVKRTGLVITIAATLAGSALVAFSLSAQYVGSMILALGIIYTIGLFSSTYILLTTTAIQMSVPDELRGRVMGFYGMTWDIAPLGAMSAGLLATGIGVPWSVAIGGFALIGFALGPALMNTKFRRLSLIDGGTALVATEVA